VAVPATAALCIAAALVVPAWAAGALATGAPPAVTSVELVEQPERWDGKRVSFTGEAVGSAMRRGELTWLHLNDDAYGLATGSRPVFLEGYNSGHAVTVPSALAQRIEHFGSYSQRGDLVRIEGVFRSAAPEHGGDMLIEADALVVERAGEALERPVGRGKAVALAVLAVAAGAAYYLMVARRRAPA